MNWYLFLFRENVLHLTYWAVLLCCLVLPSLTQLWIKSLIKDFCLSLFSLVWSYCFVFKICSIWVFCLSLKCIFYYTWRTWTTFISGFSSYFSVTSLQSILPRNNSSKILQYAGHTWKALHLERKWVWIKDEFLGKENSQKACSFPS